MYMESKFAEENATTGERLPAITILTFRFPAKDNPANFENIYLASQRCPNYVIISSKLSSIFHFTNTFQKCLSRQNSRYALISPDDENFSANSFLEDIPFFKKVLNLAVIITPINYANKGMLPDLKNGFSRR